jgi:hypothetical protein
LRHTRCVTIQKIQTDPLPIFIVGLPFAARRV